MTKSPLHRFRAEQNTLNAVLRNGGGRYTATSASEAQTFRRRCYAFISAYRETAGPGNPYDTLELQLPRKGSPDDNILTIRILSTLPTGKLTGLTGEPLPVYDEGATTSLAPPSPAFPELEDLDLTGLFEED